MSIVTHGLLVTTITLWWWWYARQWRWVKLPLAP